QAENNIAFLLGGRVAEEMIFGDYTNGASNDIERATALATRMVTVWGMSPKLGPIKFGNYQDQHQGGYGRLDNNALSDTTARAVDEEIARIITEGHELATKILRD